MATERDETWWRARAEREEGHFIAAGALAMDPDFASAFRPQLVEREQSRVAFGKFIELMRRSKGWTVEDLASEADLEIGDVLLIEDDLTVLPEPRTVYQLARVFKIPQTNLMQISGLSVPRDPNLRQETVRFAARSQSVEKLSDSEHLALEQFVSVLSRAAVESASDQSDSADENDS
jgi:transcriptional regulator with XRE-family HTH domain